MEKVVVIIDQIDAVSELLDIKSGRLNILLNLIHNLSGLRGVHIIAASREFEYRHDVRLYSVNADKVNLEIPVWEQIAPVLEHVGHETSGMSDVLKELLRTPLHLKVFLDVAKPGAVFHSLHALLEELWEQRVLAPHILKDSLPLLNDLARRMAEEESLWLPLSCTDGHPKARRFLEQNDILVRGQDGLTIGFRHQTYYDYTLTRAFANGSIPLADYIFQRQDGLFVRPTFLSGLHYLRATSPGEYHKQLQIFFKAGLRTHLFSLLLEFLGSQKNPDDTETYFVLPLLKSDTEGPKILGAVVSSPGWFSKLYGNEGLYIWMNKGVETASHCVPFLASAADFAGKDVIELLKKHWLSDTAYDSLTLSVLLEFKGWDSDSVLMAEKLVNRSELWTAGILVEKIAEISPKLAHRVLRARLDGKLAKAIQEIKSREEIEKELQEDEQYSMSLLRKNEPLEKLLENRMDFTNFELMAEEAPESFLQWIWPWFLNVINLVSYTEHDFVVGYRSDTATHGRFERAHEETILTGLLAAIKKLAESDVKIFLQFVKDNTGSDLLCVHSLLARGLSEIVATEPQKVLEYLLGDPRRLYLGDFNDSHKYTSQLISGVFPCLGQVERLRLEEAVLLFNRYKKVLPEWDAKDRRYRLIWNRQHRLRLLRALPEEYLSLKARQIKGEEERAFPHLIDYDSQVSVGSIGPRLNADEMAKASDDELINLFDQLPDETQWDNPKRRWEDSSRGGGAVQQSREFKELAKGAPSRVVRIISSLEPGQHESYVGAGLERLAESDLPIAELTSLVENLDRSGFISGVFREGAASALEKLAEREKGLSDGILSLLEKWLTEHPEPYWPEKDENKEEKKEEIKGSILFGTGGLFVLPHGRGTILRAIIAGYLERQPSDCNNWTRVIRSRLKNEPHPDIWALTMMHMPILFNGDPKEVTQMYNAVIQICPQVLEKQFAIYSIARVMRRCQPVEVLQEWLDKILACSSEFNHQAYGEMLFLYHCYYQDSWASDRIMKFLSDENDENILLGLACGASHLWSELKDRTMAREILCRLASHHDKSIQQAVADVFHCSSEHFQLNTDIRKVIQAVCGNRFVLL